MSNTTKLISSLARLDAEQEKLERALKILKSKREGVEEKLLAALRTTSLGELDGVKCSAGRVWIGKQEYPDIPDWDKVYAYVKKHNAFELLHRRISITAVKERINAGKPVPGVHIRSKDVLEFRRK